MVSCQKGGGGGGVGGAGADPEIRGPFRGGSISWELYTHFPKPRLWVGQGDLTLHDYRAELSLRKPSSCKLRE